MTSVQIVLICSKEGSVIWNYLRDFVDLFDFSKKLESHQPIFRNEAKSPDTKDLLKAECK